MLVQYLFCRVSFIVGTQYLFDYVDSEKLFAGFILMETLELPFGSKLALVGSILTRIYKAAAQLEDGQGRVAHWDICRLFWVLIFCMKLKAVS